MPIVHDNSSFSSVTYNQVEVTGFSFPTPDGTTEYKDTGINIPAQSIIEYILIKITTNGALGGGGASAYFVSNVATHLGAVDGGADYELFTSDMTNTTGPSLLAGATFPYMVVDNFDLKFTYLAPGAKNLYIQATTAGGEPATACVASILVGYKTFGTS
tara:strand:- start:229 stop:705 length:477 start_codon:yes stop_codon:yes gene_type:complete